MALKRKLFHSERLVFLADDTTLPPVSLTFSFSVRGNIPEERVRIALEKLQEKHPSLRANLKGLYIYFEESGYQPIPVKIVERVSDNTWKEHVDNFTTEPYDCEAGPLIKLLWVKSDEVSEFVFNALHVIVHWKACLLIIKEFFEYLNFPDKSVKPYLPILSMNQLMEGEKLTLKQKVGSFIFVEKMRREFNSAAKGKKEVFPKHYNLSFSASDELSQKLIKITKEKKIYIGSLFCILALKEFKKHFHPEKSARKIQMSIDQTRYFPPLKKDMIFSAAAMIFPSVRVVDGMDIWKLARTFHDMLVERTVTMQDPNNPNIITERGKVFHSFRKIFLLAEFYNRIIKDEIEFKKNTDEGLDFLFLNLGKPYPLPKNPEFQMIKGFAPDVRLPFHNPTIFGFGQNFDDSFIFSFISNEHYIPQAKMEVIMSGFKKELENLVKDEQ